VLHLYFLFTIITVYFTKVNDYLFTMTAHISFCWIIGTKESITFKYGKFSSQLYQNHVSNMGSALVLNSLIMSCSLRFKLLIM